MPMPNLRHLIKSGRNERRTGAAASDVDRGFNLPKIGRQALVNQEQGLERQMSHDQSPPEPAFNIAYLPKPPSANKPGRARPDSSLRRPAIREPNTHAANIARARPDSSRVRLPAIGDSMVGSARQPDYVHVGDSMVGSARQPDYVQDRHDLASDSQYKPSPPVGKKPTRAQRKFNADQSYSEYAVNDLPYQPKPPAIPAPSDTGILTKAKRHSRMPVRDDATRFSNAPKRKHAAEKVPDILTLPSNRQEYGVASGDLTELTSENGLENWSTSDGKETSGSRGFRRHTYGDDDDDIVIHHIREVDHSDPYWDMSGMDEKRLARIDHYTRIFDMLVQDTDDAIRKEKNEEMEKKNAEKAAKKDKTEKKKPKKPLKMMDTIKKFLKIKKDRND